MGPYYKYGKDWGSYKVGQTADAGFDPKLDTIVVGHDAPLREKVFEIEVGVGRNMKSQRELETWEPSSSG